MISFGGKLPKKMRSQKLGQDFPMALDDEFKFGKYKGTKTTLSQVIDHDIQYVEYCMENVEDFELDNEAFQRYMSKL